jgi:hypothetical protein
MTKMARYVRVAAWLLATTGLVGVQAQSLGEAARRIRAQKNPALKAKADRVYDNANMPRSTSISVIGGTEPVAAPAKSAAVGTAPAASTADAAKAEETAWKAKFAKARGDLAAEERRLDMLQRELNLAQIQAYSDPNQANREAFTRNEVNKRTAEIDQQKQVVEAAKKALADLEEELRKKGLPSGWAQP